MAHILCLGKVVRDETLLLSDVVIPGNGVRVLEEKKTYGGMVAWAARTLERNGHTSYLLGCAGADLPQKELAKNSIDAVSRQGRTQKVRVLVFPSGQRSFLGSPSNYFPTQVPIHLEKVDGILLDGYSLLPNRLGQTAVEVVQMVRATSPNTPVCVVLPVSSYVTPTAADYLQDILKQLLPVFVLGGEDEHEILPNQTPPWVRIVTTGIDKEYIAIFQPKVKPVRIPVTVCTSPKNTTGAGDIFAAIFTASLATGTDLTTAIRIAHVVASDHVNQTFWAQ